MAYVLAPMHMRMHMGERVPTDRERTRKSLPLSSSLSLSLSELALTIHSLFYNFSPPSPSPLPLLPLLPIDLFVSMLSRVLPYPPRRSFMAYHSWKPNTELAPICPRCDSSNTKFCYYNNYSLTQPRYFCKGCRRYWTKGGTLRNVPVGGGCRKNRRGKSARPQANHPTSHSDLSYDSHRSSHAQHDGVRGSSHHSNKGSTTIDLAQIYTKFVNHRPELNSDPVLSEVQGEIMDESFSVMGAGEPNSAMNQMPGQGSNQLGGREITEALFENYQTYTEDSNFSLDPGSSESVAFSSEGVVTGNDIPVSDSWVAPPTCPGFQPLLEDDMFHHQDLVIGDWYLLDQFYNLDY